MPTKAPRVVIQELRASSRLDPTFLHELILVLSSVQIPLSDRSDQSHLGQKQSWTDRWPKSQCLLLPTIARQDTIHRKSLWVHAEAFVFARKQERSSAAASLYIKRAVHQPFPQLALAPALCQIYYTNFVYRLQ